MSTKSELKAALPADFSGKSSDASRWIKAMKVYFTLNSILYSSNEGKVTTTLNKMSEGWGANFAEMWYDKLTDPNIPNAKKTFEKFAQNFKSTFYPFDIKATARLDLSKLIQKSIKCPNGSFDDSFQQYITNFQNLSCKAGITNNITLINQFCLGLDQKITTMILSMSPIPITIKNWIDWAKMFHAQKMRIQVLRRGQPQTSSFNPQPQKDPNTMDVDTITISKLTPAKRARCFPEGLCLRCWKKGHNANNCRAFSICHPTTQNIHATEITTPPTPSKINQQTKLNEYINSLKTSGKNDEEIFSTLKMCYEEPPEELAEVSVYPPGVQKAWDFWKGKLPQCLLP